MKLKEIEEKAKSDKNVLRLKVMHDLGEKIVYSYVYKTGNVVSEGGFTVYIVNRGSEDEEVYFIGGLPPFMITQPQPHILETLKDEVIGKCDVDLIEGFNVNTIGNYAVITGYKLVENKYVRKTFIATVKDNNVYVNEVGL